MNRFPNILGETLNIEEEDNDDLDVLYAATRRSEGFSQGRIRRHRGSVPGHRMVNRDRVEVTKDFIVTILLFLVYMKVFFEGGSK